MIATPEVIARGFRVVSRATLFVTALAALAGCASSQSDGGRMKRARTAEDYLPRTLPELVALSEDEGSRQNKMETMIIHSDVLPTRADGACGGARRPMPPEKTEVLRQWARRYAGAMDHYTVPYTTEMRFIDGSGYWVAVRTADSAELEQACATRASIALNVIRLGAVRDGDRWEPLLLLESIGAP